MTDRELALACLDYLTDEPVDHVHAAAEAGFDAVTLRVAGSLAPVRGDVGTDPRRRARVQAALRETGLGVLDVEVLRLSTELRDDDVARAVDLAAELSARHLLVVNSELEPAAAVDRLGRVVETAASSGVRPVLEFMPFTRCRTLADAIATAAPAGAGVLIDVLHLIRSGSDAAEVADAVTRHGPGMFPYLQICDAPLEAPSGDPAVLREEAVSRRRLPGDGELPIGDLLAALSGTPLAVEAPDPTLAGGSVVDRASAARQAVDRFLLRKG